MKTLIVRNYCATKIRVKNESYNFCIVPLTHEFIETIREVTTKSSLDSSLNVGVGGTAQMKGYIYRDKERIAYISEPAIKELGVDLNAFGVDDEGLPNPFLIVDNFPHEDLQLYWLPTTGAYLEVMECEFRYTNTSMDGNMLLTSDWVWIKSESLKPIFF